jgi:sterol desaturase/sphingolipid hydroxylase (fatty acid hydroxylase superfamily)
MSDWIMRLAAAVEMGVGWIFSPSWLPPGDFEILRWLVVPGYGYGFLIILFAALELLIPQSRRPWNRATILSGTYVLLGAKMGVYAVIVAPAIRQLWLLAGLPSLHLDRVLPLAIYMPVATLVVTFTAYWSHRLMHRVPLFWNIHKIHHSVENLSFASTYQMHFLEYLLHTPTHTVAMLALGTDLVSPFGLIFMAIDFLAHSNVRLDLGRLAYVLATPQAHRVHHSLDPRHHDTNFGNTFMLWDHVFGTFYYDPADCPTRFGIQEHVPKSFWKQQVFPVVDIARSVAGSTSEALLWRMRGTRDSA